MVLGKIVRMCGKGFTNRKEVKEWVINNWKLALQNGEINLIFNYIGESSRDAAAMYRAFCEYVEVAKDWRSNPRIELSIKPSQFGNDHTLIYKLICKMPRRVMDKIIWIDAEEYKYSGHQQKILEKLLKPANPFVTLGMCIQVRDPQYLRRVHFCLDNNIRIRLCKGAYPIKSAYFNLEGSAYKPKERKGDMLTRFKNVIEDAGEAGKKHLIEIATMKDMELALLAVEHSLPIQALYGWHEEFMNHPHGVKVYIAYGTHWGPYIWRRLAGR